MEFKTYADYRAAIEKAVNSLPLFWAFSESQLEEELAKRNATRDELFMFMGGLCLEKDKPKIDEYVNTDWAQILYEHISASKEFAKEAFLYEMYNHEYMYNWEADYDVCECFATRRLKYSDDKTYVDYLKEIGYSDDIIAIYRNCVREVMSNEV